MKKKILVVDDPGLMRRVICDIINSEETFQATDVCRDGLEAYEKLKTTKYDGVALDVNMPKMDGLQLLERLQKEGIKVTVVMVSTATTQDAEVTIRALELGAVDFVNKPTNVIEAKGEDFKKEVLKVFAAAMATQESSKERRQAMTFTPRPAEKKPIVAKTPRPVKGGSKIVALACSTGGPKALQSVIPYLPANLDAPMVLVQHMPAGFTKSMADRLNDISPIRVKEAEDGEVLQKGCVYVAPGGKHMEVKKNADGSHRIAYSDIPAIGGLKPCANITYDSLRDCGYDQIICVVLTGMGADGTNGIISLAGKKAVYVIAQDAATSVVYGMPKAIAEAGMADEVVPLTEIAKSITKNTGVK